MLSTIEYLSLLRKYMRENAVKYGISRMGIFGSVARGEQHDGSDCLLYTSDAADEL